MRRVAEDGARLPAYAAATDALQGLESRSCPRRAIQSTRQGRADIPEDPGEESRPPQGDEKSHMLTRELAYR